MNDFTLKACPFCGAEATAYLNIVYGDCGHEPRIQVNVKCTRCRDVKKTDRPIGELMPDGERGIPFGKIVERIQSTVDLWNRRKQCDTCG